MAQLKNTKINGTTEHLDGHIYLTGVAGSSTQCTTQLVFGTPNSQHFCMSSNDDCVVFNKDLTNTDNQITFYLGDKNDSDSKIPGLKVDRLYVNGKTLLDRTYPVGAVYISYNATSPSELFGGSWAQITGVFPRFDNNTSNGGSDTHTLTTAQMPAHTHTFTGSSATTSSNGAHTHTVPNTKGDNSGSGSKCESWASASASGRTVTTSSNGNHTHTLTAKGTNSNAGSGEAHNNMPKYQNMYAWRRTA
jgi:hypothetical protein